MFHIFFRHMGAYHILLPWKNFRSKISTLHRYTGGPKSRKSASGTAIFQFWRQNHYFNDFLEELQFFWCLYWIKHQKLPIWKKFHDFWVEGPDFIGDFHLVEVVWGSKGKITHFRFWRQNRYFNDFFGEISYFWCVFWIQHPKIPPYVKKSC